MVGRFFLSGVLLCAAGSVTWNALPSHAFAPSDDSILSGFGALGRTHGSITRAAWLDLATQWFATSTLTDSMLGALTTVMTANADVDKDQTRPELHFDAESFTKGQERLESLGAQVVSALQANSAPQARNLLGQALHSIQDFYSHSNWVELGNTQPYPSMGQPGTVIPVLAADVPTCQDCVQKLLCNDCSNNTITNQLTSGYYHDSVQKPIRSKCSHGGQIDRWEPIDPSSWVISTGDGINKDNRQCLTSPHSNLHDTAADVATAASKQFIQYIKSQITTDQLGALFGTDQSISIITTGGTSSKVRRSLGQVGGKLPKRGDGGDDDTYLLDLDGRSVRATFMEPHAKSALRRRDAESDSITGLFDAIVDTPRGSFLFIYANLTTDLASLDPGAIGALAILREVRIFAFLFGSEGSVSQDLFDVIHYTGGQIFVLNDSELDATSNIVKTLLRNDGADIAYVAMPESQTIKVPVDSTLNNITFSISGARQSTIFKPDGSALSLTDDGLDITTFSSSLFVTVTKPTVGVWSISLPSINSSSNATTHTSVSVTCSSPLDLGFTFTKLGGRPGHTGYMPITSRPAANVNTNAYGIYPNASLANSNVSFAMLSPGGTYLAALNLTGVATGSDMDDGSSDTTFYTATNDTNILPATDFIVYSAGVDSTGNPFQRLRPGAVSPSWIGITAPPPATIHPGTNRTLTVQIANTGAAAATINVTVFDGLGYVAAGPGETSASDGGFTVALALAGNATQEISVALDVPADAPLSTTDMVGVLASSGEGDDAEVNYSFVQQWIVNGTATVDTFFYNGTVVE